MVREGFESTTYSLKASTSSLYKLMETEYSLDGGNAFRVSYVNYGSLDMYVICP